MYRKNLKTQNDVKVLEPKPCRSILKRTVESPHSHSVKKENILKPHASGGVKSVKFKKSKSVQQARLRSKLNDWLEIKGKTPTRYFNLMYFDEQLSAKKRRERSLPGKLSEDLVGKQVQSLKKEEDLNARKRLFKDDNCGSCKPTRRSTPSVRRCINDKQKPGIKLENTPTTTTRSSINRRSSTQDRNIKPFSDKSNKPLPSPLLPPSENQTLEDPMIENEANSSQFSTKSLDQEPQITDEDIRENLLSMLQECLTLFRAGCPSEHILSWLENMEQHIPQTQTCALFYACKAELFSTDPIKMLEVFCQGVENKAEPSQVISDSMRQLLAPHLSDPDVVLTTIKSQYSTSQNELVFSMEGCGHEVADGGFPENSAEKRQIASSSEVLALSKSQQTPSKNDLHLQTDKIGSSSTFGTGSDNNANCRRRSVKHTPVKGVQMVPEEVTPQLGSTVKYTVAPVTPIPGQSPSSVPTAVVTPVRRSTRLSNCHPTPTSVREIDNITDLTLREAETTMYFSNSAIEDS